MTSKRTTIILQLPQPTFWTGILIIVFFFLHSDSCPATDIPPAEITSLKKELTEQAKETSATKKRRICKSVLRKGNSLIEEHSTAPNRFQVLAVMLQSHRLLLALENSEKNRESLFETCVKLAKAPDTYAELRLDADLILMEKTLSEKKADLKERTLALKELTNRYRNTPGEAKSLQMAILIAPKLEAFDLEQKLIRTLTERFQSDHGVIEFRKKNVRANLLDVVFKGTYKCNNGSPLTFPIDRMGHNTLLYFWSQQTPELSERFADVKEIQTRFPDRFKVYSFNLDELPDAGEQILRKHKLDWRALHLPNGKANSAFQAYIGSDPGALFVNAQGHALIASSPLVNKHVPLIPRQQKTETKKKKGFDGIRESSRNFPTLEVNLDNSRLLAQQQALFIGDFLVSKAPEPSASIPAATLNAIQACFTAAPQRYRISQKQALENYTKADQLCQVAIQQHPGAADLWKIRNRRIIALLGMWNLATEPKHLQAAAVEAQTTLATTLPDGANIVPHFCLAKNELRIGKKPPATILGTFIKATGENNATAIAAVALLAMDANNRDVHAKHRQELLKLENNDPSLWPVITFLRDRHHTYRAFHATFSRFGYSRAERHANYRNIAALDEPADTSRVIETELTSLEGKKITLPKATNGKITYLAFLELPADQLSENGQNALIKQMQEKVDQHKAKGIKLIAAFLSRDKDKISSYVTKHEWKCEVTMVPDGLDNPLVAKHGILSADLTPNIFLLRPDGSISWSASGLTYPVQGSRMSSVVRYGVEAQLNVLQYETAKKSLDQGDFKQAVKLFSDVWTPGKIKGDWWATFRHYSRARAYVGLKNWTAALTDMDIAIEAVKIFAYGKVHRCELLKEMELYKADILDQLGRSNEAKALRTQAAKPTTPYNKSPYGIYTDDNRKNFRLNPHSGK